MPARAAQASRAFLEQFGADPLQMADDVLRQALDDGTLRIFAAEADRAVIGAHAEALRGGELPPSRHGLQPR